MQAYQEPTSEFAREHQLVTAHGLYRAVGEMKAAQVIAAFKSYAFEKKDWARELKWERIEP